MMVENSVLFISADPTAAVRIEAILRHGGEVSFEWHSVEALLDGLRAIQEQSFDLILADLFLPDGQGLPTLRNLQQHAPATPVVALVHSEDRDTAVTALRNGAYDFFCYEDIDHVNLRRSFAGALRHPGSEGDKKAPKSAVQRHVFHVAWTLVTRLWSPQFYPDKVPARR
jgi:two-component system, cell cycle sensor histidine kinase and response regulator CckA